MVIYLRCLTNLNISIMSQKNICFIPLRRGSKSIAKKNWKVLYGKPLFCWILDSVLESGISDEIWIATDSPEIKDIAREKYNGRVSIFDRSTKNAQDTSVTLDVVLEFLTEYNSKENRDYMILLQATSPFTSVSELKALSAMISENKYDSIIACCRLRKFRWDESGFPLDYSLDQKPPRTQDYKGFLVASGSFYVSRIADILKSGQLLSGEIGIFEVNPKAGIDIDDEFDWKMAETYLQLCNGIIT